MKYILLLLTLLFLTIGCSSTNTPSISEESSKQSEAQRQKTREFFLKIRNHITEEDLNIIPKDKFLLNYKIFPSTAEEVDKHTLKLLKSGVIEKSSTYTYRFPLDGLDSPAFQIRFIYGTTGSRYLTLELSTYFVTTEDKVWRINKKSFEKTYASINELYKKKYGKPSTLNSTMDLFNRQSKEREGYKTENITHFPCGKFHISSALRISEIKTKKRVSVTINYIPTPVMLQLINQIPKK